MHGFLFGLWFIFLNSGDIVNSADAGVNWLIRTSQNLDLYSNGELQYIVPEEEPDWFSTLFRGIVECGGDRKKPIKKTIKLSRSLKIQKESDVALSIIDKISNKVLDIPSTFVSKTEMEKWMSLLQQAIDDSSSYSMYMGIKIRETICLSYSLSPIFCGEVEYIGKIDNSKPPVFAIWIDKAQFDDLSLNRYIGSKLNNGFARDGVQYFNFDNNVHDKFIVLEDIEIFENQKCVGVQRISQQQIIFQENKDFFTLTMPQVWDLIESQVSNTVLLIPGTNFELYAEELDLSKLNIRIFNLNKPQSVSYAYFDARIKVFGDVSANIHVRTSSGSKFEKSQMRISKIFLEGDIRVNYQFMMEKRRQQRLQFGFIKRPFVEILKGDSFADFPLHSFGKQFFDHIEWLEVAIRNLLANRGINNMLILELISPYDV